MMEEIYDDIKMFCWWGGGKGFFVVVFRFCGLVVISVIGCLGGFFE